MIFLNKIMRIEMKTMFCTVLLVVSIFVFVGCKDDKNVVEPPKDTNENYEVATIDGKNIEEFRKSIFGLGTLDIPNKIVFTRRDSVFEGKVFFDKIGERNIDKTCPRSCFSIALNGELGKMTTIYFTSLQFVSAVLDGKFVFASPLSDTGSLTFRAKKK